MAYLTKGSKQDLQYIVIELGIKNGANFNVTKLKSAILEADGNEK